MPPVQGVGELLKARVGPPERQPSEATRIFSKRDARGVWREGSAAVATMAQREAQMHRSRIARPRPATVRLIFNAGSRSRTESSVETRRPFRRHLS
jgi:hypothetical protein